VMVMEDDSMAIRHMVHLSLTFDHRIIDGMYGCAFLNAVKQHLEKH
jgi:2-oxoglutarate dehydrogenase E2 component (dihydrolipoamide succinyltransferase)